MEPIAPTTFASGQISNSNLQQVTARSATAPQPSDSASTPDIDDAALSDSVTLGAGVIPSLAIVTRRLQREMEIEVQQQAERAAEDAQIEQQAERRQVDRASLDAQLTPDYTTAQPDPTPQVGSTPQPGHAGPAVFHHDVPHLAPIKGATLPARDLLTRVTTGLRRLEPQQLALVHRLNFSIKA